MDLQLSGKQALVTGASAGLGAAAALSLAAEGAKVAINSRDRGRLENAAQTIQIATGVTPGLHVGDVSSASDVTRIVGEVGPVDILVVNTGGPPPGQFLDLTPQRWNEAGELLIGAATHLTRAVLPGMIERKWGRVIYITSVAVLQPVDNLILSNSYRAGVTGLCKTLSNNYARHGITFNCVCPGYTLTERLRRLADSIAAGGGKTQQQVLDQFTLDCPSGRLGRPDELAALIAFLAGDKAAYITGASIPVDGGLHRSLL